MLEVGSKAPDFVLPNQLRRIVQLSTYRGKSSVVLYFFPHDNTRLGLRGALAFRDSHASFRELGTLVCGISVDSIETHRDFARKHQLPFNLLMDLEHEVHGWYGVGRRFFVLPARVSFLIDLEGVVRHRCRASLDPGKHVQQNLQAARALAGAGKG